MACRGACCCSSAGRLNADNARFLLLAVLIVLYMLCGAAVFSAIELPTEREAKERWEERLENFTRRHNLSRAELRHFLREYEEASVAGIRVDDIRPRWDFTGAFYFVGTVVSTIGERRDGRAPGRRRGQGWVPWDALFLCSSQLAAVSYTRAWSRHFAAPFLPFSCRRAAAAGAPLAGSARLRERPRSAGQPGRRWGWQGSAHRDALHRCLLPPRGSLSSRYGGGLCERPLASKAESF